MKPIPIGRAESIAKYYGYDQIIIIARKVGDDPKPHGEHCTTFGIDKANCDAAARVGDFLKFKVMGWAKEQTKPSPVTTENALRAALQNCVDYWPSALNDDLQERTLEEAREALKLL